MAAAIDSQTRAVLAAGLAWLYEAEQPDGALDQHHGYSRAVGDRIYRLIPVGLGGLPVVVVDVREPRYVQVNGPDQMLVNPLDYPGELRRIAEALADLGRPVADQWNGMGETGSLGLATEAHPSLVAAVRRYHAGCPRHRTVFCGDQHCTWFRDGKALIVPPNWPLNEEEQDMARIATVTEETTALAASGRGLQLQPGTYPVVEIDGAAERHVAYLEGPDGGALVCISLTDPHVTIGEEGQ